MGGLGSSAVSCTPPTVPWLLSWMRGRFRWASRLASDGRLDTNQPPTSARSAAWRAQFCVGNTPPGQRLPSHRLRDGGHLAESTRAWAQQPGCGQQLRSAAEACGHSPSPQPGGACARLQRARARALWFQKCSQRRRACGHCGRASAAASVALAPPPGAPGSKGSCRCWPSSCTSSPRDVSGGSAAASAALPPAAAPPPPAAAPPPLPPAAPPPTRLMSARLSRSSAPLP
jgi:hypothetical protein